MSLSEEISDENPDDEKNNANSQKPNKPQIMRFHGKDIEIEKLKKKVGNKPRIFGTILLNITIILVIIIILLIVF